jgi:vacuolar-type H+-ATPase subunit F/Vma7
MKNMPGQNKNYKAAVIGRGRFISLFRAAGYDVFEASSKDSCRDEISRLTNADLHAVIFIEENLMPDEPFAKSSDKALPVITALPTGQSENKSESLARLMERAIGSANFNLLK